MKSALIALMVLAYPFHLSAGVQSIHTEVLCPGGRPGVAAYFEQTDSVNSTPQSCRFLYLTSDPTQQQRSTWRDGIQALQSLTLTSKSAFSTPRGLRQDQVDGQGRIRKVVWISAQGLTTDAALFDQAGHILSLDLWRNQTVLPDADLKPLVCGRSTEKALNIRVFQSASGNINAEVGELELLANTVTDYALVHDLGLTTTANSNQAAEDGPEDALAPTSAFSLSSTPKTAVPSLILGQPLVVAPNPAEGRTLIFYQLPAYFTNVKILIYDLAGRVRRKYIQGSQGAGVYELPVDLGGLSTGVYFVFLAGDRGSDSKVIGQFKLAVP
ncbi:MAG: T9SS type A sorting domain-containing protein [bacterium]